MPRCTLALGLSEVFAQARENEGRELQCCPGAPTEIYLSCMI